MRRNVCLWVFQLINEGGKHRISLFCHPSKLMNLSSDLHWLLTSHINQAGVMYLLLAVYYIAFELSLPRNQQASRSNNQFTGSTKRRGICWITPWICNQQNLYCGILHREVKKHLLNKLIERKKDKKGHIPTNCNILTLFEFWF